MSYCRFSRGYYLVKKEDLIPSLLHMFPAGVYSHKSDVYAYQGECKYILHILSDVEPDGSYDTPWELAERLIDLEAKGYTIPRNAIADLVEEQLELEYDAEQCKEEKYI